MCFFREMHNGECTIESALAFGGYLGKRLVVSMTSITGVTTLLQLAVILSNKGSNQPDK